MENTSHKIKNKTKKIFAILLLSPSFAFAGSIDYMPSVSRFGDITVSSLTSTNAATFASSATVQGDFLLDTSTMYVNSTLIVATGTSNVGTPAIFIATNATVGINTSVPFVGTGLHVFNHPGAGRQQVIRLGDADEATRYMDFIWKSGTGWQIDSADQIALQKSNTDILLTGLSGSDPILRPGLSANCEADTPSEVGNICAQNSATCPIAIATSTNAGGFACVTFGSP